MLIFKVTLLVYILTMLIGPDLVDNLMITGY